MSIVLHVAVSLLPVAVFLSALVFLDSYKLVRPNAIAGALFAGAFAAATAYFVNGWMLDSLDVSRDQFSRYIAPISEEILKSIWIVFLVWKNRIGFTVDAAITGFAIGAGFAVVENLYFLSAVDAGIQTWVVRGFGTAIMHGVTTTVFAILFKTFQPDQKKFTIAAIFGAFLAAVFLHSGYNHFPFPPLVSTAILVMTAPILVMAVFSQGEKHTRAWLGTGFDTDQELLTLLMSGNFSESRVGSYLLTLKDHFAGTIVADMFCLIRIKVELSIRAKGLLMMREAGFEPPPDESIKAKFAELQYLEKAIGKTGMMAIEPIHKWSDKDLWQLNMIGQG